MNSKDLEVYTVEMLAMAMWQKDTAKSYGWGDVPETHDYRNRAREILRGDLLNQRLVQYENNSEFEGYVIFKPTGEVYMESTDVISAAFSALECSRSSGSTLRKYVKAYTFFNADEHHANPGTRLVAEFDWRQACEEHMI